MFDFISRGGHKKPVGGVKEETTIYTYNLPPAGSNKPLIPSDLLYLRANHKRIATITINATMDFLASTTDIPAVIACMQLKQCLQVPNTLSAAEAAENILTVATTSGTKTASTVEAKSPMIKYGIYLIDVNRTNF